MSVSHTPYDGSSKPFTIGLQPLDPVDWIEVDEHYDAYVSEKHRLYAERPTEVFAAEDATLDAQAEVFDLVSKHLAAHVPQHRASAGQHDASPLKAASLLVQEDLVLMRKGDNGWRLAAASLCFPSSWSLAEKYGKSLSDIHGPVPQFGEGTRNAQLIERMFDNLQGQVVLRWNWSLQADDALFHPLSDSQRNVRAIERSSRFVNIDPFIRVERQTLRKLPRSGDILFTIRIYLDPLQALEKHQDRQKIAAAFAAQLAELDTAQLEYKGLAADRDLLVSRLRAMAQTR
jgi:hypothetical protein